MPTDSGRPDGAFQRPFGFTWLLRLFIWEEKNNFSISRQTSLSIQNTHRGPFSFSLSFLDYFLRSSLRSRGPPDLACSLKSFFSNHFQSFFFFISPFPLRPDVNWMSRSIRRSIRRLARSNLNTQCHHPVVCIVSSCPTPFATFLRRFFFQRFDVFLRNSSTLTFDSLQHSPSTFFSSDTLAFQSRHLLSDRNKDIKSWPILSRRDTSKLWTESTSNSNSWRRTGRNRPPLPQNSPPPLASRLP